jgi:hypothetical protein
MGFPIFNATNIINNLVSITVTGNIISVMGENYTLPNPVLFMLPQNTNGSITYVTNQYQAMVTESVTVSTSLNSLNEIEIVVMYNYYYQVINGTTFNAQSVTLQNGQIVATLNPTSMQALGLYSGQYFTLSGNILTGQTMITANSTSTTIPSATA